jgi:hypothetical protein
MEQRSLFGLSEHLERKRLQKARMPNFGQFTTLNPVK